MNIDKYSMKEKMKKKFILEHAGRREKEKKSTHLIMLTSKPAAVKSVDRGGSGGNGGALDVHIPLSRLLVNKHVQNTAVFVTLLQIYSKIKILH